MTITDEDGNTMEAIGNVTLTVIEPTAEWDLITKDTNNVVLVTPHIGGRPNDRK